MFHHFKKRQFGNNRMGQILIEFLIIFSILGFFFLFGILNTSKVINHERKNARIFYELERN
jgi:hypothetical protein